MWQLSPEEASPLHILMLHQTFAINEWPGRRFFEIGSRLTELGHQVTVITGNSKLELMLGKKRIGLLQEKGMAIVALNTGYSKPEQEIRRRWIATAFARQSARQGRRLPPPDLVLASLPPLALAGSARSLSSYYGVPLILEIREIADILIGSQENLLNKLFNSPICRRALKACRMADSIIVPSLEVADRAAQILTSEKVINILPDDLDCSDLYQKFSEILTGILK